MSKNIYQTVEEDYDNVDLTFHNKYDSTEEFKQEVELFKSKLKSKARILNVGGTAAECNYFLSNGHPVDDIDVSQAMLDYIKSNSKETTTIKGNVKNYKTDKPYKGIWACRSLIHIPPKDLTKTLENIHALLSNDGFFGAIFFSSELSRIEEEKIPEPHTEKENINYYRALYPKDVLLELYRKAGFAPMYVNECEDKDGDKCIFVLAQHVFFTKNKARDWIFGGWLNRISRMERIMQMRPENKEDANEFPYDVAYILFPLIEAVSFNLFGKGPRVYLADMQKRYGDIGFSSSEIDLFLKVFRNGMTHNTHMNHLDYYDGDIGWGITSGNGVTPFNFGYTSEEFPEDNEPPEKVFEYIKFKSGTHHASLSLERLIALVRDDLNRRQSELPDIEMPFTVGQRQEGARPPARSV